MEICARSCQQWSLCGVPNNYLGNFQKEHQVHTWTHLKFGTSWVIKHLITFYFELVHSETSGLPEKGGLFQTQATKSSLKIELRSFHTPNLTNSRELLGIFTRQTTQVGSYSKFQWTQEKELIVSTSVVIATAIRHRCLAHDKRVSYARKIEITISLSKKTHLFLIAIIFSRLFFIMNWNPT